MVTLMSVGTTFALISLAFGLFFFMYAVRYYVFTIAVFLLQLFTGRTNGNGNGHPRNGNNNGARYRANGGVHNGSLRDFASFLRRTNGENGNGNKNGNIIGALSFSAEPFVSIHLPFYNERNVAERILLSCLSQDYGNYEIIVVDDSTDETVKVLEKWQESQIALSQAFNGGSPSGQALLTLQRPALKIVHRETRSGFKGGALNEALKCMNPQAEYVIVLDADFVPPPDFIKSFLSYISVPSGPSIAGRILGLDKKFASNEITLESYLHEREALYSQIAGRRSLQDLLAVSRKAIFDLDQSFAEGKVTVDEYLAKRKSIIRALDAAGLQKLAYSTLEDRTTVLHSFELDQLLSDGKIELNEYVKRRRLLASKQEPVTVRSLKLSDILELDRLYGERRVADDDWFQKERRWLAERLITTSADRKAIRERFELDQSYAKGKISIEEYLERRRKLGEAQPVALNGNGRNGASRLRNLLRRNGNGNGNGTHWNYRILWRRKNGNGNGRNGRNGNGGNGQNGNGNVNGYNGKLAAVQGYQWHYLNKSENWLTRGIRAEYSGNYVIERTCEEIFGGMKMIAGSVYMIRADLLRKYAWGKSLTEDWELTCRLYGDGYRVQYTPQIQVPAECPSTITRLIRQRQRWAEGHTFNAKRYFWKIMKSPELTIREKLEFLYFAPYYLQSLFFMIGTFFWLLSESIHCYLPFWTATFGWSLLMSNLIALPLMNLAGLYAEESARKDLPGVFSTIVFSYVLAPFQAYSALKGLLEKREGQWIRTFKTGMITEPIIRARLGRIWRRLREKSRQRTKVSDERRKRGEVSDTSGDVAPPAGKGLEEKRERPNRFARLLRGKRPSIAVVVLIMLSSALLFASALSVTVPVTAQEIDDTYYLRSATTSGITPSGGYMDTGSGTSTSLSLTAGTAYYWYYRINTGGGTYANPWRVDAGTYQFTYSFTLSDTGRTADLAVGVCNSDGSGYVAVVSATGVAVTGTSGTVTIGTAGWQDVSGKRLRFTITVNKAATLRIEGSTRSRLITPTTQAPEALLFFLLVAPIIPMLRRKLRQKKAWSQMP